MNNKPSRYNKIGHYEWARARKYFKITGKQEPTSQQIKEIRNIINKEKSNFYGIGMNLSDRV